MAKDSGASSGSCPAGQAAARLDASRCDPARVPSEKICMDCGGHNPVWFAPNDLWNLVIGGPEAKGDPGGFYCPVCFIQRAEATGMRPTAWVLTPESIDG